MKTRLTILATAAAGVLVIGAAVAQAQPDEMPGKNAMDRIHNSEQMRELRDQMPGDMRDDCDAWHERMSDEMPGPMGQHGPPVDLSGRTTH